MVPPHTHTLSLSARLQGWLRGRRELCLQTPLCKAPFPAHVSCGRRKARTPGPQHQVTTPGAPPPWTPWGAASKPRGAAGRRFQTPRAQAWGPQVTRKVREKCPPPHTHTSRPGIVRAQSFPICNYRTHQGLKTEKGKLRPLFANERPAFRAAGESREGVPNSPGLTPPRAHAPPRAQAFSGFSVKARRMPHLTQAAGSPRAQEQSHFTGQSKG